MRPRSFLPATIVYERKRKVGAECHDSNPLADNQRSISDSCELKNNNQDGNIANRHAWKGQIFGGFSVIYALNLESYVDIQGNVRQESKPIEDVHWPILTQRGIRTYILNHGGLEPMRQIQNIRQNKKVSTFGRLQKGRGPGRR